MTLFEGLTIGLAALSLIATIALFIVGRSLAGMARRGEARRHENVLILQGLDVIGGMSCATAKAVRDQHCNGEVTEALERYGEYKSDLKSYLYQQAAEK